MNRREELQSLFEDLLGSRNVYYQPPESLKMSYPAIKYSVEDIVGKHADDTAYILDKRYQVIVIDKKPDNEVIMEILKLPNSSFDRHYESDNLNHDVITLYY